MTPLRQEAYKDRWFAQVLSHLGNTDPSFNTVSIDSPISDLVSEMGGTVKISISQADSLVGWVSRLPMPCCGQNLHPPTKITDFC